MQCQAISPARNEFRFSTFDGIMFVWKVKRIWLISPPPPTKLILNQIWVATSSSVDDSKWSRAAQLQKLIKRENLTERSSASLSESDKNIEKKINVIFRHFLYPSWGTEYVCLSGSCVHPYMHWFGSSTDIIRQFRFFRSHIPVLAIC